MKVFSDIIVIGGGASGMMAAISAAGNGKKVLILEHNDKTGKKILQTGNGRCNLTNLKMDNTCFCRENAGYAMKVIMDFDEKAVMNFFHEIGLLLHDRNGYVYPYSDQASSVRDVLNQELKRKSVRIETEIIIEKVIKREPEEFEIRTTRGVFICNRLILAAGSRAYPKSGSDGSGYEIARKLGHSIVEPLPALTSLKSDFKYAKAVSGVRCNGMVRLLENGKEIIRECGEIQMTDYGISGIPVFQISRYAVQGVFHKKKMICVLDFLPDYTENDLLEFLAHKGKQKDSSMEEAVSGMIHKKLSGMILKLSGCSPDKEVSKYNADDLKRVITNIKNLKMNITGYNSFDYGQVCQGGVSVDEINADSMESKIVKGLYFAGEIMDIDGICGGYNLQWAWSSGYKAGKAAGQ